MIFAATSFISSGEIWPRNPSAETEAWSSHIKPEWPFVSRLLLFASPLSIHAKCCSIEYLQISARKLFLQIANSVFNMHSLKEGEDQKEISIEPAHALDEVEPLPEDCYSRPISLTEGVLCASLSHQCRPFIIRNLDITEVFMCPPSDNAPPAASPARFPTRVGVSAPPQTQTPSDEALAALQGEPRFRNPHR